MRYARTIIAIYLTSLSSKPTHMRLTYSHSALVKYRHLLQKWRIQPDTIYVSYLMVMSFISLYIPLPITSYSSSRDTGVPLKVLLGKTTPKHLLKQITKSRIERRNCSIERS